MYTGRTCTLAVTATPANIYSTITSVCQCVISLPHCILPVYVQYTLATLDLSLGDTGLNIQFIVFKNILQNFMIRKDFQEYYTARIQAK